MWRTLPANRAGSRRGWFCPGNSGGDQRLPERFRSEELLPLGSRIRVRLTLERATPEELRECLQHALAKAGRRS